jgi:predicted MPP superfamily phosphohydrolase
MSITIRIAFLFTFFILIDLYSFQAFKKAFPNKYIIAAYWLSSILVIANAAYVIVNFSRYEGPNLSTLNASAWLLTLYVPKLFIIAFLFGEDVLRLIQTVYNVISGFFKDEPVKYFPERRKAISQLALLISSIPFASMIYGIAKGKYNFKVFKEEIYFDNLPEEFDGFKVTQISDTHVGSFNNREAVEAAIDLINEQRSDLFVFTGDLVNNKASEMLPWIDTFKRIKAPFGKFSIMGNHDYGDYLQWPNAEAKKKNLDDLHKMHHESEFDLLLNRNVKIAKGKSQIAIVGVENWGKRFKQKGDLYKAMQGTKDGEFKILLSHDPSHWDAQVKDYSSNIDLTLSGHTHGMQFGIEIPGFKWSPVQYVYKHWAGLFQEKGRYLYVNRGFGFHAFPGRVGIWPEITVFTLRKK